MQDTVEGLQRQRVETKDLRREGRGKYWKKKKLGQSQGSWEVVDNMGEENTEHPG